MVTTARPAPTATRAVPRAVAPAVLLGLGLLLLAARARRSESRGTVATTGDRR